MKTKAKTKKSIQTLSRATQKTFIITAALAYLVQAVMIGQLFTNMITMQSFDLGSWLMYPITAVILPLLAFVVVYFVGGKKNTKLWRLCQASLVAFLAVSAEAFLSAVNTVVFRNQLGFGGTPAESGAMFLQLIPMTLTLLLTAAAALWLRSQNKVQGDATPVFQKVFVILFPSLAVAQIAVMMLGSWGDGASDQYSDPGMIVGVLTTFIVPAIVLGIMYLLTSKQKTIWARIFVSVTYLIIGIFLMMVFMLVSYQMSSLYVEVMNDATNGLISNIASLLGLASFIALVVVHKMKKLL